MTTINVVKRTPASRINPDFLSRLGAAPGMITGFLLLQGSRFPKMSYGNLLGAAKIRGRSMTSLLWRKRRKMGRGSAVAIIVCLLVASTPAAGNQFLSANDLLQLCDTD